MTTDAHGNVEVWEQLDRIDIAAGRRDICSMLRMYGDPIMYADADGVSLFQAHKLATEINGFVAEVVRRTENGAYHAIRSNRNGARMTSVLVVE